MIVVIKICRKLLKDLYIKFRTQLLIINRQPELKVHERV